MHIYLFSFYPNVYFTKLRFLSLAFYFAATGRTEEKKNRRTM